MSLFTDSVESDLNPARMDEFGESITYRQPGQVDVTITAIFSEIAQESGSPGSVTQAEILAGQTTETPAAGDWVMYGGITYKVADQPVLRASGQSWVLQLRQLA